MVHECNVFCHSVESDLMELMGKDDSLNVGKWLPFALDVHLVIAIKMATDDQESSVYKCTTVFFSNGEVYIIDTKYKDFLHIWKNTIETDDSYDSNDEDSFNL